MLDNKQLESIEDRVSEYRIQLIKEMNAIEEYKREFGREPCCSRKALIGDCSCWQDRWC